MTAHLQLVPPSLEATVAVGDRSFVVADPEMQRLCALLRRLAGAPVAVLLTGETGTGKEMAAHALHAWSPRAAGPFVAVNAAALPENLVESELFGHRKGSFSGAQRDKPGLLEVASGGTLFLDEIGELPLAAQAKLLRALDTRQITPIGDTKPISVDVRVIAATNRDLAAEVRAGRFREDLLYRLAAIKVLLPPLRDRPLDVALLAETFVRRACERASRPALRLSDAARFELQARSYPGNVRELANTIEVAVAVAAGDEIEAEDLPAPVAGCSSVPEASPARSASIADEVAQLEMRRMREALASSGGNQSRAADLIGMPRRTFVTKFRRYALRSAS